MTEVNAELDAKVDRIEAIMKEEELACICHVWDKKTQQCCLFVYGELYPGNVITAINRIIDFFQLDVDGVLFSIKLSKAYRQEN